MIFPTYIQALHDFPCNKMLFKCLWVMGNNIYVPSFYSLSTFNVCCMGGIDALIPCACRKKWYMCMLLSM